MIKRLLGHLLHLANSNPPAIARQEFYAMKDRILSSFGHHVGHDIQEIKHICYECGGSGSEQNSYGIPDYCHRCGGDGVYRWVYVRLEKWELGGFSFHIPRERLFGLPSGESVSIRGRIKHANYGVRTKAAQLWLSLFFDRPLFFRLMTNSEYCQWHWRSPMLIANNICRRVHRFYRSRCDQEIPF